MLDVSTPIFDLVPSVFLSKTIRAASIFLYILALGFPLTSIADGFVASVGRVPFSQLPDSRKLKYIDFLATRLKNVGNLQAPVTITMFMPGDCKECLSFLDGPVFKLRGKFNDVKLAYAIVPTSPVSTPSALIYYCADAQNKLRSYFSTLDELKDLGFSVTDVTEEFSTIEFWKRREQKRGLSGIQLERWIENRLKFFRGGTSTILQLAGINRSDFQECRYSPHTLDRFREYESYIDELEVLNLPALFIGTSYVLGLPDAKNLESIVRQERRKDVYGARKFSSPK